MDFFYLCLSRDIAKGEYKSFSIGDHELVLGRKDNGQLILAKNMCRHRGFMVCDGRGVLPIKCPYHGLQFNFEEKMFCFSIDGFIFGSTKDWVMSRYTHTRPFSEMLGVEFATQQMSVKAPFHLWMQNTADPNHLKFVHSGGFADQFESDKPLWQDLDEPTAYGIQLKKKNTDSYEKYFVSQTPDLFKNVFVHILVAPNLSLTSFHGMFLSVETAIPTSKNTCFVITRFFTSIHAKLPDILIQMAKSGNARILEEDKALVERWSKTYDKHETKTWLPGEERIQKYLKDLK